MTDNRTARFKARLKRDGKTVTLSMECDDDYLAMWLFDKMLRDKGVKLTITEIVDADSKP